MTTTQPRASDDPGLLRIQEVAAEVGLTPRSIRYYEEVGLLEPAARSEGAYRLYDESDIARLRFIRGLRDDAGFSLTQIGQLLEDEAARERNRERFRATGDPAERPGIEVIGVPMRHEDRVDSLEPALLRPRAVPFERPQRRPQQGIGHDPDAAQLEDGRRVAHEPDARRRHHRLGYPCETSSSGPRPGSWRRRAGWRNSVTSPPSTAQPVVSMRSAIVSS